MRVALGVVWLAAAAVAAAPVVVFEDAPAGVAGLPGSVLRVGASAALGYRPLDDQAAGQIAAVGPGGTVALTPERPFGGATRALLIRVSGDGAGWWSVDLPLPAGAALVRSALLDGRLMLAVRGDEGGEALEVGLTDSCAPRHSIRLPLSRYGRIETSWTVFSIPLDDFATLAPDLALDRLAVVQLFSARGTPLKILVGHVRLEPGPVSPEPTRRVVLDTPPAQPTFKPAEPAKPALPLPPPVRPAVITPPRVVAGGGQPGAPGPVAGVAAELLSPGECPPVGAAPLISPGARVVPSTAPAKPGEPLGPPPATPPPTLPAPTAPGKTVELPPPVTAGQGRTGRIPPPPSKPTPEPPVAPVKPAKPVDDKPMVPVSFFFTTAALGAYEPSALKATFATNQGERGFDAAELKEFFALEPPDHLPVVAVEDAKRSGVALQLTIKQPGFAWWMVQIQRLHGETSDERNYLRNGRLEVAVKGAAGGEVFRVGLADGQAQPQMALVTSERHSEVTTDWTLLRIPLRALKAANPNLDWSQIKAVVVASANGRAFSVQLADLRIVTPPGEK